MEHIHRRQIHQLKYVPKLELACGGQRWKLNIPRSYRDIRKLITNVCRQKKRNTQKQMKKEARTQHRNKNWQVKRMWKSRKTGENTKKNVKVFLLFIITFFHSLRFSSTLYYDFFLYIVHPFEYALRDDGSRQQRAQKDSQNENVFIIIPSCLDIKWNICKKNKKKKVYVTQ